VQHDEGERGVLHPKIISHNFISPMLATEMSVTKVARSTVHVPKILLEYQTSLIREIESFFFFGR
jgi:hypothetical protein